ncbi:antimicrobial peptide NK-lysin-like [Apteryx rowi]|uniref:antimicrobial peptide NK-lysin-like n=1 Tax=Apteryx rowi TaxID=308060 RepID=UPI000E1E0CA9|nr:antimicrobial peptide NK-lysin-like [Apteryx rowi]
MAAAVTFALVLAVAGALATHAAVLHRCHDEEICPIPWDSSWDLADGAQEALAPGKKCALCTKILQQIKKAAGEEPDEDAVRTALAGACKAVGRRLGRVCKWLVKKYGEQIVQALEDGQDPQDACRAMRLCKG